VDLDEVVAAAAVAPAGAMPGAAVPGAVQVEVARDATGGRAIGIGPSTTPRRSAIAAASMT
jgi:hypothetical protein